MCIQDVRTTDLLRILGFRLDGLLPAIFIPPLLTGVLFAGPLLMDYLDNNPMTKKLKCSAVVFRNLVAAPITEELCFRSGLVSFWVVRGVSITRTLLLSPLLFGLAHVHHAVDLVKNQKWPLIHAFLACLFQFSYTVIFGWYAAFLFLRTGHIASVVTVHCFCNFMGFPPLRAIPSHPHKKILIITYLIGIAAFALLLFPLSNPRLYGLDDFGSATWHDRGFKISSTYLRRL